MAIPKDIVEKMETVNSLMLEIDKWMYDNIDTDGSKHQNHRMFSSDFVHEDYYEFEETPCGREQEDGTGEYCDQHMVGIEGDCYEGRYYIPTEKGNYFAFDFIS